MNGKSDMPIILAACSDKENITLIKKACSDSDTSIEVISSGDEAINACNHKKYDLLLFEKSLTGLDCIFAIKRIREHSNNVETHAICLISNNISSIKEMCIEAGYDDVLTKAQLSDELTQIISEISSRSIDGKSDYDVLDKEIVDKLEMCVPNINVSDAIEKYSGTLDFYLDMLSDVVKTSRIEKMETSLKNSDFTEYRLNAHTLKGLTRSVGLYDLANLFETLQKACDIEDYNYIEKNSFDIVQKFKLTVEKINETMNW